MVFNILVAEDEEITLKHLVATLKGEGYEVLGVNDGLEAYKAVESWGFDLIIADIKMPGMSGLELLAKVKEKYSDTEVIIITGYGSISSAIDAIRIGAHDYVTKPLELGDIVSRVKKIYEKKLLQKQNAALGAMPGSGKKLTIIANSPSMNRIIDTIESLRESECNVLLTGESGVGKNLLAKLIHFSSKRETRPFLAINCATLTEELLASELFGHEKGAFTGAIKSKQGLIEIADTGTLFLDEISEMTTNLQAKLLKAIEDGEFYRVGGTKPVRVNVRFIAATNQNVKALIVDGKFREDLYYRLNVMEIFIPPLRERREDIEPLSRFFLEKQLPKARKKIGGFTKEAIALLKGYSFPGNVRELENIIERAIILEKNPLITPDSLPQSLSMFQIETFEPGNIKTIDELTRAYAVRVLDMVGGNKSKAAVMLGISRTSLWRILKEE